VLHDTVVVSGPLKEALDTARAQPVDGRKWTIKQCRNGGRKGGLAKGMGLKAKGMPSTGRAAKGVAQPRGAARKGFKTAEEKEAYHKMMCDMASCL
jgi:hypothetical protein